MSEKQTQLARKSLDRRLARLREERLLAPSRGWAKAIRESLGMTTRQLAQRMGVAPSRVTTIEKAEPTGAITLKTLRETAEAMNCEMVYAFVPSKPLDTILYDQAERKVRNELAHLNHTMRLENQALTQEELEEQKRRIITEYLSQFQRRLWEKE
jgi:predicted DNA-binding mobile mystery protein A